MSITTTFTDSSVREGNASAPVLMPDGYLFLKPPYFKSLTRILENKNKRPKSIIVDLDAFKIEHFSAALTNLRAHKDLFNIPVIGVSKKQREDTAALLAAGLDDCFFGELDWAIITKRIQFLSEFKQLLQQVPHGAELKKCTIPFSKRLFDIVVSSAALIVLSPLFLLIAILIKLESKGPVFYAAKRIGTGYQEFYFMKFRSMRMNADKELQKLAHLNSYEGQSNKEEDKKAKKNTFFKIKNDPRVTRIGRIIRKTSIDELPQLINVLRGEMSIIGNRPLPLYEAEQLTRDEWARRFLAPAGITGLWQVDKRGKDNLSTEDRVGLDMEYANGVSVLTDFKILFMTIPAMWQRD